MNICTRAALAALAFTTPALAENCQLKLLSSIDMQSARGDVMLVPAGINGAQVHLLLDTGGGVSSVTEKTVEAFKLTTQQAAVKTLDMIGNASRQFVRLDSLELGQLKGKDMNLMIWPNRDLPFDGLIAGDILSRYDVELNFVTYKLNLFSQDHCEGKVVYWPATAATAVSFSMTRPLRDNPNMGIGRDTHIRVPVALDGKHLQAIIDTGATFTTMGAGLAESAFGMTAASPGVERLDDQRFGYAFHSLSFEGITVANPRVMIRPDLVGTKDRDNVAVTGSLTTREDDGMQPELIIGMDVLTKLHLYIAYGERKLYITPPDQSAATATAH